MSFQAYINNIKTKTGKTPDDFKALAKKKGLLEPLAKVSDIVDWLKKDFDLGHGHAMAIYAVFKSHPASKGVAKKEPDNPFTKLSKPAQRALAGAGITNLKALSKLTEEALSDLHGIGPNAIEQLKQAIADNGLSFTSKK